MDLLLGTLAALGAALAGWACFALTLMGMFVLSQILFGWGPGKAPSGFALDVPPWYGKVHVIVSVAGGLVPLTLLLICYPPSRIPCVALLVVLGVVASAHSLRKKPPPP